MTKRTRETYLNELYQKRRRVEAELEDIAESGRNDYPEYFNVVQLLKQISQEIEYHEKQNHS